MKSNSDNMPLFDYNKEVLNKEAPLAARLRPRDFNEFVGQEHLLGSGHLLRRSIESDNLVSMIFWGPPGSGKTTLAQIIASKTKSHFSKVSAVNASVADLRKIVGEAKDRRQMQQQKTILFIDEIHRFNKGQQDSILPYVEDGTVTLIGATTENPSFEVISALLSRCRVFTLKALSEEDIRIIIMRSLTDKEFGLGNIEIQFDEDALAFLLKMSNGDGRIALNALELAAGAISPDKDGRKQINLETVKDAFQHHTLLYDKTGEQHYNIISALHKSLRGSDVDAALYWLARMVESGEDPLYIARRLVRFASEDVGMADPQALVVTIAAQQAVHFIGMPEGNLALAEAVVYLATSPKSNSLYTAYTNAKADADLTAAEPVPLHIRNAVTGLMKKEGYGEGYKYDHNYEDHFAGQQHLPDKLIGHKYYKPGIQGFEKEVSERIKAWWERKKSD
ncbi:MAG: replication-associated recombination protein A [Chloroflexi bacterium]|nr:replication-associated recombination protein A [Chloroflexota bacterium]